MTMLRRVLPADSLAMLGADTSSLITELCAAAYPIHRLTVPNPSWRSTVDRE